MKMMQGQAPAMGALPMSTEAARADRAAAAPSAATADSSSVTAASTAVTAATAASAAGTAPALRLRGVVKSHTRGRERIRVLSGLDLDVRAGEMVSVMGPSGSGKSTLLDILCGITRCDAGEVMLAGQSLQGLSDAQVTRLRARHVGFVFQFYHLIPVLSAEENVALPLSLWRLSAAERKARTQAALTAVGMEHRRKHRPEEMSGGEQQRVAIARALVGNPDVLLCDEPTGDLNRSIGAEIMDVMEELRRSHAKAIVVVTHDAEVARRADRQLRLEDGLLHAQEPA